MFWMYREGTDARIDTQLATSRDGRHWQRVADRQTFLANARIGSWDDGMSRAGRGINVVGDTIYLHYSMLNGPHRSPKFPRPERKFPGGKLHVNANTKGGWLRVSVLDESGGLIQGFEGSQPISADNTRSPVSWDNAGPDRLDAKRVRLKFTLRNGSLFSYWIEEAK
jgi:hypothetical protein